MKLPADKIIEESQLVESQLYSLLSRVEQRRSKIPAAEADGEINQVMARGLQNTLKLTQEFTIALKNKYPYNRQSAQLRALVNNLTSFQNIIEAMEGDRNLSPFFDRMIDREYNELINVRSHFLTIIRADSDRLSAMTGEEILATERHLPLPVVAGIYLSVMPVIIMSGIFAGILKGLQPQPPPRPLLKLVHNA